MIRFAQSYRALTDLSKGLPKGCALDTIPRNQPELIEAIMQDQTRAFSFFTWLTLPQRRRARALEQHISYRWLLRQSEEIERNKKRLHAWLYRRA
jgi:hypothetical protein